MTRPTKADAGGRAYLELQNLGRREGRSTQSLLTLYVLERFLARLEASAHTDEFVLKGGMLLAVWGARRATVDGDFLVRNVAMDSSTVLQRIAAVAAIPAPVEDGVAYRDETATVSTIRDGDRYGGVRVVMDAMVGGAQLKLRLDVSTGDPVIPSPQLIDYPTLRGGHPVIRIAGYPRLVVLAEKLCTAVELGFGNSRLRDYADMWTLLGLRDVAGADFERALRATAAHRGVPLRALGPMLGGYAAARSAAYTAYRGRLGPDSARLPTSLIDVLKGVIHFADPVLTETITASARWSSVLRRWDTERPHPLCA